MLLGLSRRRRRPRVSPAAGAGDPSGTIYFGATPTPVGKIVGTVSSDERSAGLVSPCGRGEGNDGEEAAAPSGQVYVRQRPRPTGAAAKRVVDVVGATVGLILLAPLMAYIALRVRNELGNPVLFSQRRPGLSGRVFTVRKFRTMTGDRGPDGELLADELRLRPFGRFLRSTSLDELPELWNVLSGEMSLVGPRPLLVEYLDLYTSEQARRHEVKPGLTGWAQINGRNDMPWDAKLALDVWYVDHRSLWLDLWIILRTVWVTVSRKGIALEGHATTVRFGGTSRDSSEPS
jgi:sugar transferase EpsL